MKTASLYSQEMWESGFVVVALPFFLISKIYSDQSTLSSAVFMIYIYYISLGKKRTDNYILCINFTVPNRAKQGGKLSIDFLCNQTLD